MGHPFTFIAIKTLSYHACAKREKSKYVYLDFLCFAQASAASVPCLAPIICGAESLNQ